MSYENIWEATGLYRKYSNDITGEEIIESMEDGYSHPSFNSVSYVINDFLNIKNYDITTSNVLAIAEIDKAAAIRNQDIKVAIVATTPTLQVLATLYGDLIDNSLYTSEVFTNVDEARLWISE